MAQIWRRCKKMRVEIKIQWTVHGFQLGVGGIGMIFGAAIKCVSKRE